MDNKEEICRQLQEEIDREISVNQKQRMFKIKIITVIFLILFLNLFGGKIKYYLGHLFAVPYTYSAKEINVLDEPYQKIIDTNLTRIAKSTDPVSDSDGLPIDNPDRDEVNLYNLKTPEFIKKKTLDGRETLMLLPMAKYSISGLVVAKNVPYSGLMYKFDQIALFDIGIWWGPLAENPKELNEKFSFSSEKFINGMRRLRVYPKKPNWHYSGYLPVSHTHVIPANDNILSALLKVKVNQKVKLDGYLVDVFGVRYHYRTSLSRNDAPEGRGCGSCEGMYVTGVQIGRKAYR